MYLTMGSRALSGSTCDDVENKSELIRFSSHAHTILKRSSEKNFTFTFNNKLCFVFSVWREEYMSVIMRC